MIPYGQEYDEQGNPVPESEPAGAPATPQESTKAADADEPAKSERGPSQATLLRSMALGLYDFVAGEDGSAWAVPLHGPRIARPFRGGRTGLRAELAKLYAEENKGAVPSASALADAMTALEGEAQSKDPVALSNRVAEHDGRLYLDLGRTDGHVVQIRPGGWRVLEEAPAGVLFRRTQLTGPLPNPTAPGSLAPLRARLNVTDEDWPLALAWLVSSLMPSIPHPVLSLIGEQGTGKSTATRLMVCLIDPSPAPTRAAPRDAEQWAVAAAASWVVGLDNLSGVQPWLSDLLCRAVTGDGIVRRQLYTDGDVSVLSFRRVIVTNGIDYGAIRGDLADRMLTIELHRIDDEDRRTETAIAMHEDDTARVLGALLDLAAETLAVLPGITLTSMPRMADFSRVAAAVDKVAGTAALERYARQATDLAAAVVDGDPFAAAVRALVQDRRVWEGDGATLLGEITVPEPRPRPWPADGQRANAALRRVAPALRVAGGLTVSETKDPRTRRTIWRLVLAQEVRGEQASQASQASNLPLTSRDAAKADATPGFAADTPGFADPQHAKPGASRAKPGSQSGFAPSPPSDQQGRDVAKPAKPAKPPAPALSGDEWLGPQCPACLGRNGHHHPQCAVAS